MTSSPRGSAVFNGDGLRFVDSILAHQWDDAENILLSGLSIKIKGNNGITSLVYSSYISDYESFSWLLKNGADPNIRPTVIPNLVTIVSWNDNERFIATAVQHSLKLQIDDKSTVGEPLRLIFSSLPIDKLIRFFRYTKIIGPNLDLYSNACQRSAIMSPLMNY